MPLSPLELQAKSNFNYTFRNIALLYEALTHSCDNSSRVLAGATVVYRKKNFYRLKTLGISVLQLLLAEQALRENDADAGPGILTVTRQSFLEDRVLIQIGRELKLYNFVEVQNGFACNSMERQYPDVIKALIGAVFVDADNDLNTSLIICMGVLHRMFENTNLFTPGSAYTSLEDLFPPSTSKSVGWFLLSKSYANRMDIEESELLCSAIGYKFNNPQYLLEALTHSSCKQYAYLEDVPDFERLEFLGDAVYELVICEYLFWHYADDDTGEQFNKTKLENYTSEPFQRALAEFLSLRKYLLKPSHVEVKKIHQFLESLIGAIYVDSGRCLTTTKAVLIGKIKECELDLLNSGCVELPYTITASYPTKYRLANEDVRSYIPETKCYPAPAGAVNMYAILDNLDFLKNWQSFTDSEDTHLEQLGRAMCAALDETGKRYLPLACANKMQYKRTSVYGVAAQKLLHNCTDPVVLWEQIWDAVKKDRYGDAIFRKYKKKLMEIDPGVHEALSWKRETTAVPESRSVSSWNKFESKCYDLKPESRDPHKSPIIIQPSSRGDNDDWVTMDDAQRAAVCLWKFFWGRSYLVGKWAANKMWNLILNVLQIMLFLFLVFIVLKIYSHWGIVVRDIPSKIGMQRKEL